MFRRYKIHQYEYSEIANALFRFYDDLRMELMGEYFFHYPREIVELIHRVDVDWKQALVGFPSLRREVMASIDCYALGDYSGCVFHMMRVAETGLRAIARERGVYSLKAKKNQTKPIAWGTWQEVFHAIGSCLVEIRNAPQGPKRDLALNFYNSALTE